MKNKKGFTLVELMAVIVVIGIIALISVPAYHGTVERMKQKSYENKVFDIETKAEEYAASTNRLLISVQDLVDAGSLEADNEEGDILSPIDNERMNCYIIETILKDGSYESNLTDENNCDTADRIANNQDLKLIAKIGTREINPQNWQKEDVTLEASFQANEELYSNITYKWLHINEEISGETTNIYKTQTETITNNIFTVAVHATKAGEEVNLTKSVRVKVDKQAPSVDEVNSKVIDGDKWGGPKKEIQIKGIDYDGSGIASYYIGSKVSNCSSVSYSTTQTKPYGQGVYSLCVKDKAGNVSKPYDVLVDKIDTEYPYMEGISYLTDDIIWQNYFPYTFTLTFKDKGGSGVHYVDVCEMPNRLDWYNTICRKIYPEEGVPIQITTNAAYTYLVTRDHAGNVIRESAIAPVDTIKPWSPFVSAIGPYDTSDYIDNYNNCVRTNTASECEALYGDEGFRRDVSDIITCDYFGNGVAAENHCTVYANKYPNYIPWPYFSDSTDDWMEYSNYSDYKGWYYMREDKNGNVVYPKTFFVWNDINKPRQWYNADGTTEYFWGLDNAGNEGHKLIVKYVR